MCQQSGHVAVLRRDQGSWARVECDPLVAPPLMLSRQSGDFLYEAFRRCMPLDVGAPSVMCPLADAHELVFFSLSLDRASANWSVASKLWSQFAAECMPSTLLPHFEPCSAHGIALAKARSASLSQLLGRLHGWTCLLRQTRHVAGFRDGVIQGVRDCLRVVRGPRPRANAARAEEQIVALFGPPPAAPPVASGGVPRPGGTRRKSVRSICLALEVAELVDFDADGGLTHWCWLDAVTAQSLGKREGDRCCETDDVAASRVAGALVQVLVSSRWPQGAVSRWTYALEVLRLAQLGNMCGNVLCRAVEHMCQAQSLAAHMTRGLTESLLRDASDVVVRNSLRLLKCHQLFSSVAFRHEVCISAQVLQPMDALLWHVFGAVGSERASLSTFLSEDSSPVAQSKQRLLELAIGWSDRRGWDLLSASAVDPENDAAWRFARALVLQFSAGLHTHFEGRFSKPPYTLVRIGSSGVPLHVRRNLAGQFLAIPAHCASLLVRRVQARCPTPHALLELSPALSLAFAEVPISIDASERAHARVRQQLLSSGRAQSFAVAAHRSIVMEAVAAHLDRGLPDCRRSVPAPLASVGGSSSDFAQASSSSAAASARVDGRRLNPFLAFCNSRMRAWKLAHAPTRAMTSDERRAVQQQASSQWSAMSASEVKDWQELWKAGQQRRQALGLAGGRHQAQAELDAAAPRPSVGLWVGMVASPWRYPPWSRHTLLCQRPSGGHLLGSIRTTRSRRLPTPCRGMLQLQASEACMRRTPQRHQSQ